MENLNEILAKYEATSLEELEASTLMNRTDTKFIFPKSLLSNILAELEQEYKVLEVDKNRISPYETLYFDFKNHQLYLDHHNGKNNRYKVRKRKYISSDSSFIEVKTKYKGRTIKNRRGVKEIRLQLSPEERSFIGNTIHHSENFEAKLWSYFKRITLVNKSIPERVTFDIDLSFKWGDKTEDINNMVVAELKQGNLNRKSGFYAVMKKNQIRPSNVSKYCIGTVFLYGEEGIKTNRFKEKLLQIKSLSH